jgi:hypothetical protein
LYPALVGFDSGSPSGFSSREVPLDLARAGEARHFVSWRGAVAGLGGGRLTDLATAAKAVLTDVFLSASEAEGGVLRLESRHDEEEVRITLHHPELAARRMAGLSEILARYLDDHDLSPTRAVLVKKLGGERGSGRRGP